MSSLGYTVSEYGSGCHDVYLKPPVFNFEMHVSLFSNLESESLTRYFTGALDRAIPGDGAFLCTFTPEDQYLYIKSHEYKHFSIGGTGVRSLLDTYVYLRAQGAAMDSDYLGRELGTLGISEFERQTRELARKIFDLDISRDFYLGLPVLTPEEERMLAYYFGSGVYGNMENKVSNALSRDNKGGKFGYILRRVFPPLEWYRVNEPFYYRHKILIPAFVIKRAAVKLFTSPRKLFSELKILIKSQGNDKNESEL
jgi:hypothetical protein